MLTIAILIWAILIIFIAEAGSPGFLRFLLETMAVVGILYFGGMWLIGRIKNGKNKASK